MQSCRKMSYSTQSTADTLFRVRRTILEMLQDRDYVVTDSEIEMTKDQFMEKFGDGESLYRESLDFSRVKRNDPTDEICVFFTQKEKVAKDAIQSYVKRMICAKVSKAILVVQHTVRQFLKSFIENELSEIQMEFFLEAELMINITKHTLVPKHQVLTSEEKRILIERYNVRAAQLPHMQTSDPVARYYGLKHGQVVKITRASETAGTYVTYRIAV